MIVGESFDRVLIVKGLDVPSVNEYHWFSMRWGEERSCRSLERVLIADLKATSHRVCHG